MYPFCISTDEYLPLKILMTKHFIIIIYLNQFFLRKMLGARYGPVGIRFL